jgi:hypothetical protein
LPVNRALNVWRVMINKWSFVQKLSRNKLLASSYIWLVIVPIFAKLLAQVESPIELTNIVAGLVIDFTLPFSWKAFYCAALLFSISGLVYSLCCPKLIQSVQSYGDFKQQGLNGFYLKEYAQELSGFEYECNARIAIDAFPNQANELEPDLSAGFQQLFSFEDSRRYLAICSCLILYLSGLALITWVLIDNAYYVLQQIL